MRQFAIGETPDAGARLQVDDRMMEVLSHHVPGAGIRGFPNRREAGRLLAAALRKCGAAAGTDDVVMVGLARGGVEVAAEVAAALHAPLDALAVRKVGHPRQPGYGIGAVAPGDIAYVRAHDGLTEAEVADAARTVGERAAIFGASLHRNTKPMTVDGARRVLVDDGLASSAEIHVDGVCLPADLTVPEGALGWILFAHGSGSSRRSPRNVSVATSLNDVGFATLLFDLLTPEEALDRENVFDVELLRERLVAATRWLSARPETRGMPVGYFGASTGAAAALLAAAELGDEISAVVSRGGRPDLAWHRLADVRTPTLLIVGGADRVVLDLNQAAAAQLTCPHELTIVPGATHLFEEPGALERVAELATAWFTKQFSLAPACRHHERSHHAR